ncbi:UVR8, partial [Symbiodinium pilosum]
LLSVAVLAAKMSSHILLSEHILQQAAAEDWEEMPGMQSIIRRAEALGPQEISHDAQHGQLPWIRADCVIDVAQATAYLGQAIVFLYKAIDYKGLQCPDNSPSGCAASVAGVLTSLSWIASYVALAASSCKQAASNFGALCTSDFFSLQADFGELATSGAAVGHDCNVSHGPITLLMTGVAASKKVHTGASFIQGGAGPILQKALKIKGHMQAKRQHSFDMMQCVMDVTNSATYLVRAILQIRTAALSCSNPKACVIGITGIISSYVWVAQFTALAVSDCQVASDQKADCAADITDMVAALTNVAASGLGAVSDCAKKQHHPKGS